MVKRVLSVAIAAIAFSGCVSMLTHLRFSDSDVQSQANMAALLLACAEKGFTTPSNAYAFVHALTELYSVAVYNKGLYEATYQAKRAELVSFIPYTGTSMCADFERNADAAIATLRGRYADIASKRRTDVLGMSQSMSGFGSNGYSSTMYIPIPSNQVTFGHQQTQRNVDH